MPRLQILQHKSYHPYLEKNKQRVREDEARARAEEEERDRLQVDSDAANRLNILRQRAGSPSLPPLAPSATAEEREDDGNLPSTSTSKDVDVGTSLLERHRLKKARDEKRERKAKDRLDFDFPSDTARREKRREDKRRIATQGGEAYDVDDSGREAPGSWETGGHVNLFADLEAADKRPVLSEFELKAKRKKELEDPFTMYLGRPEKETKPWYADRELRRIEDRETGDEAEERRARDRRKDQRSKNRNDPLTHISSLLASSSSQPAPSRRLHHPSSATRPSDPSTARQEREHAERQRALALVAKAKAARTPGWGDTPSSVGGGGGGRTWEDQFERDKARAGDRYFAGTAGGSADRDRVRGGGRFGGRSWEV